MGVKRFDKKAQDPVLETTSYPIINLSQNVVLIKFEKKFLSNRRGIKVAFFRVQRPDY